MAKFCATPGCQKDPLPGRNFCEKDSEKLRRIREEIEKPGRGRLFGPRGKPKRCAMSECPDFAKPDTIFCLHHLRLKGLG